MITSVDAGHLGASLSETTWMGNGSRYRLHHNCESFVNEVARSGLTPQN